MAAENDPEQSAKSLAGILELLRSEREVTDDVEVLSRSVQADVQVVESEEPAQELHLGSIRETVGRGVAGAATSCHRNSDDE